MKKPILMILAMLMALASFSQTKPVSGTVTDQSDGTPLAGVTVTVKGTTLSTTTQPDGSFSIKAPASATTLVFSIIGFQSQELPIGTGIVEVRLSINQKALQEVVVTGYAVLSKRQYAGSVTRLAGNEISGQPVGSFDKALQGKVPGLLSQSSSGQPGSAASVIIRGKGSINGTNAPLYIVDGVQVNGGDFATINPADIESYNVLKDASSAAIYGSRGANGVIVITTKRGAAGKTKIDYDGQAGYSELPTNRLELMNSAEKLQYEFYDRDPSAGGSNPLGWTPAEVDSLSKIDNGLRDALFRKGLTQQHQLSASGGNDKTRFYISGSIFDQQGIVKATGLKRYTGRVNLDNTFGNLKIGLNATFGYSRLTNTREGTTYVGSPLNAVRWFNPYITLFDKDGNYQRDFIQNQPNPLQELLENYVYNDQLKGVGSVYAEYNIPTVKGLRLRTQWGGDLTEDEVFQYLNPETDLGSQSTGRSGQVDRTYSRIFRYTGTTSLNFQRSFGDHEVNVGLFNEIVQGKGKGFGFTGYGIIGPFKNEAGITPGTPNNGYIPDINAPTRVQNGLVSYFVDGQYGYKGKYYLNAGARRDGSSRLTQSRRWSNFGHVGLSWIVSEENFLAAAQNWLSLLKYRVSYGSVGSQGVSDFESLELLTASVYNGESGFQRTQLPTSLTWERKVMFSTGIDFSLFQGRVSGTAEFYSNLTKDLFLDKQLSRTSGFDNVTKNLGKLRNTGIEVSVNVDVIRTKDFTWSVEANYTHNKSKLVDQDGQDQNIIGLFINKVGQPINSLFLVKSAGVDPANGDQLYYNLAGNKVNAYDSKDRVLVGVVDPPNYGGFGTTLNYKGIELGVLFSYAFGHVIFNNDRTNVEYGGYWYSGIAKALLNEWRKPGDITDVPNPDNDFRSETTRFVEKGDFLRLRNISLGYNLPASVLSKLKLRTVKVFAQGQNLHVWHNFLGYDPEVPSGSNTGSQYPQLKTIMFGLNIGI